MIGYTQGDMSRIEHSRVELGGHNSLHPCLNYYVFVDTVPEFTDIRVDFRVAGLIRSKFKIVSYLF